MNKIEFCPEREYCFSECLNNSDMEFTDDFEMSPMTFKRAASLSDQNENYNDT